MVSTVARVPISRQGDGRAPDRIARLDGLRGVAILLVLSHHFQLVKKSNPWEYVVFWFSGFGWAGVQLFFVLSGYLITGILLRARGSPTYYSAFYARRTLRIFPAYYLLLLLFFTARAIWGTNAGGTVAMALWHVTYTQNIGSGLFGMITPLALTVTWSLAVEEQFYLLWPLLVQRLRPDMLLRFCIGGIVIATAARVYFVLWADLPIAAYHLTLCRFDALAAGAIVALLPWVSPKFDCRPLLPFLFGAGSLIIVAIAWREHGFPFLGTLTLTVGILGQTLLFLALLIHVVIAPDSLVSRALCWAPLCDVGRYSYAMYLFHWPVRDALVRLPAFSRPEAVPWIAGTQWIAQIAFYAVAGLATYGIARCSWYLVEKPFLSLKDRWQYGLAGGSS